MFEAIISFIGIVAVVYTLCIWIKKMWILIQTEPTCIAYLSLLLAMLVTFLIICFNHYDFIFKISLNA